MALKITKAADPITVDRLNVVIYGPPGLGKTSLAFTADRPLVLDFDNGSHRAPNRSDVVRVGAWNEISSITADDLALYSTIVLDTAGRALDAITADIIKTDPKGHKNGALTLPGYGTLKTRFTTFLRLLNSFGKDVILIAHMEEQRSGDEVIERLDVQGGSKGEIYKAADAMGRIAMVNGERWLRFSPSDAAFGKNPGQLDPILIPSINSPEFGGLLGQVIRQTKERLNALTEEQREAMQEQEWFRSALPNVDGVDGINALLERAKGSGAVCKKLLAERASALGFTYDKATGGYVEPVSEAA